MHERQSNQNSEREYAVNSADDTAKLFEINGQEVLLSPHSAVIILYNSSFDARYNHLVLNPDGETPIRQFTTNPAELYTYIGTVPPVGSEKPGASIREAYWQFMGQQCVELDDEDIEERDRVLAAQADRLLAATTDLDAELAALLG